jgi:hypothetical protein
MVRFLFHPLFSLGLWRCGQPTSGRSIDHFADLVAGSFEYSAAAGKASVEDGAADIKDDAVFLLASQTKLLTSVAALQIVEKGLIAFDDSVEELVPELAQQKVLTGFDEDGKPVLVERTEKITFRYERAAHLLYQSHTAY